MLINFADQTNVVSHYTSRPRSSNNNIFYQYNISPGQEKNNNNNSNNSNNVTAAKQTAFGMREAK